MSLRGAGKGEEISQFDTGALLYVTTHTGELWPKGPLRGPLGPQKVKDLKM